MTHSKLRTSEAKTVSTLMKDINRIKKTAKNQTNMNILRKHQIKLLNDFLKKLLNEKRITKEELSIYMPKKKDAIKEMIKQRKNLKDKIN